MRSVEDWQVLVGKATSAITQRFSDSTSKPSTADALDGLLFFGNPHETVPRALLLDEHLGAVDVLGWQMIRLMTAADRSTAFPTYDQLQPLLRASPGTMASRGTVARVIAVLRLTRWMSLCHKARHDTGRTMGNVYALHDEPLNFEEVALLDSDYNEFVVHCLSHNNRTVRLVADRVQFEMGSDGQRSRLNQRAQRFEEIRDQRRHTSAKASRRDSFAEKTKTENPVTSPGSHREPRDVPLESRPGFQRELRGKSRGYEELSLVLAENQASTVPVRTGNYKNTSTGTEGDLTLQWSEQLRMDTQERNELMPILRRLGAEVAQAVLDETAGRVQAGKVRTPKGLLRSLINSALEGEFKITRYAHGIRSTRNGGEASSNASAESVGTGAKTDFQPQLSAEVLQEQAASSRRQLLDSLGLRR